MKLLVTGAAGFIGSNYVHYVLSRRPDDQVTVLDKMTYAANPANLASVASRITVVEGDIVDQRLVTELARDVDAIVNFAAESHVDRSLLAGDDFVKTNVQGTHALLKVAQARPSLRLLHVSTDEVYGAVLTGHSHETARLDPRSPYSASKAGAELLVQAYVVSHGVDAVVTRGCNTIGPMQYPEKVLPLFVTNAIDDQPLPIYGQGVAVRDYLYAADHCEAIDLVLRQAPTGETYNIGASRASNTLEVAERVLTLLRKPLSLMRLIDDRPGHDARYSVDWSKLAALGWQPRHSLDDTFRLTVEWYRDHPEWWRPIRSGEFAAYYQQLYAQRLASSQAVS